MNNTPIQILEVRHVAGSTASSLLELERTLSDRLSSNLLEHPTVSERISKLLSKGFEFCIESDFAGALVDRRGNWVEFKSAPYEPEVTIPDGTYTVVDPSSGKESTFCVYISKSSNPDFNGRRMISLFTGTDNHLSSSYTAFGFVGTHGIKVWGSVHEKAKYNSTYAKVIGSLSLANALLFLGEEHMKESSNLYALRSNRCFRCRHKLTRSGSILKSCGPDCEEILRCTHPQLFPTK